MINRMENYKQDESFRSSEISTFKFRKTVIRSHWLSSFFPYNSLYALLFIQMIVLPLHVFKESSLSFSHTSHSFPTVLRFSESIKGGFLTPKK